MGEYVTPNNTHMLTSITPSIFVLLLPKLRQNHQQLYQAKDCAISRNAEARMYSISDAALALKNANKSNKQPGPEKVVLALCPLIEKTTQPHPSGNGTMVTYQIRRCPRMDACSILMLGHTDRGRIKFQDEAGYSMPQKHILSCTFGNDIEHMLDAYWELQVGLKKQALLGKYLHPSVGASMPSVSCQLLSKKDHALFEWVEMIVMENWGLRTVENECTERDSSRPIASLSRQYGQ